MEQRKQMLAAEPNPKTNVNLFHNDAPGHKEIAVAVQDMWKELGIETTIKAQEWAQFLEFLGPPPNNAVDVYRLGWIYDFPDAINGLELFTCDSGNNNTNWCNEDYDAPSTRPATTVDDDARYELYGQLEDIMFGEDGDVPITPIIGTRIRTSRTTRFATRSSSARSIRSTSPRSSSREARSRTASRRSRRRGAPAPRLRVVAKSTPNG